MGKQKHSFQKPLSPKSSSGQKEKEKNTLNPETSNIVFNRKWEIKKNVYFFNVSLYCSKSSNQYNKGKKIDKCYKLLEWDLNYDYFIGYLIIY